MLRAWERSSTRNAAKGNRLTRLMDFLRLEVESDIRINMATNGFRYENNCVFCDKGHLSVKCYVVGKKSMQEKLEMVRKKRKLQMSS